MLQFVLGLTPSVVQLMRMFDRLTRLLSTSADIVERKTERTLSKPEYKT